MNTPCAYICAGGVFYVQKESALRLRPDHIWYRLADRDLDGVGIFLFSDRRWDHGFGILVHQQKIVT